MIAPHRPKSKRKHRWRYSIARRPAGEVWYVQAFRWQNEPEAGAWAVSEPVEDPESRISVARALRRARSQINQATPEGAP